MANTFVVKLPANGNPTIEPFNDADSYKQISDAVGGMIEGAIIPTVKHTGEYGIDCFVNEEGLLEQLPLNGRLTAWCSRVYGGPLVGDAIFVGHDAEGETVGLNETDAKAILAIFA